MAGAQVITPGYRIILEARDQQYEYHTDLDGQVVLCQSAGEEPEPAPTREDLSAPDDDEDSNKIGGPSKN